MTHPENCVDITVTRVNSVITQLLQKDNRPWARQTAAGPQKATFAILTNADKLLPISNSNRTEWSTIQGVNARIISKSDERDAPGRLEITSAITPRIVRHEIQFQIDCIYNKIFWARTSVALFYVLKTVENTDVKITWVSSCRYPINTWRQGMWWVARFL